MINNISGASQDYLKAIYRLSAQNGRATTSQLADHLNVKPASVTSMLKKMAIADPPLVDYQKHQGATLTPSGQKAALEVLRHHRLLELFLHEILGFSWDEVHDEAERMEHCISERMEERISTLLGNPGYNPHGAPIPDYELNLSPSHWLAMSTLREGETAVIQRVRDEDNDMLRYLDKIGLRLNTRFTITDYIPFDNNLHLQIDGQTQPIVVGTQISDNISVEIITE